MRVVEFVIYNTMMLLFDSDLHLVDCVTVFDTPSAILTANVFKRKVILDTLTNTVAYQDIFHGNSDRFANNFKRKTNKM